MAKIGIAKKILIIPHKNIDIYSIYLSKMFDLIYKIRYNNDLCSLL
jgi:hypothetical protein